MIYGSVCSGIEAASCAWESLGWNAAFLSDIEKFPRAVLEYHYPEIPLHGDFTTIGKDDYGTIELLVGGTPCQSFSVAGLRGGMDDDRGNLALEYLKLADRKRPKWLVWENVPGVLSSNKGRDFGAFLGGLVELGYGFSYRILDAQHFGVPQRRRRVFVVGYLGDWRPAAAVLFERESLFRNPAPSRKKKQNITGTITSGSGRRRGAGIEPGGLIANPLRAKSNLALRHDMDTYVTHTLRGAGFDASEDGTGHGTPIIPVTTGTILNNGKAAGSATLQDAESDLLVCHGTQDPNILDNLAHPLGRNNGAENAIAIQNATRGKDQNGIGIGLEGDPMYTLDQASQHAVAFTQNSRDEGRLLGGDGDIAGALSASEGMKQRTYVAPSSHENKPNHAIAVRRLTPVECEKLQGFPDNWTKIPWRGKPAELCPDGPRYRAIGNSMAVPVMAWLGKRIDMVDKLS